MWSLFEGLKECITVVASHEQLKEGELTLVGPVDLDQLQPWTSEPFDLPDELSMSFPGGLQRILDRLAKYLKLCSFSCSLEWSCSALL